MKFLRLSMFLALSLFASQALAIFEGQVLMGTRSSDIGSSGSTDKFSGMETKLSFYLDPIPLIPVGFGATVASVSYDDDHGVTGFSGGETSLDLTAWLPLGIAGFKPYAKIAYVLSGEYSLTSSGTELKYDASGNKIAAGIKYSPLPFISLMFEVEKQALKLDNSTFGEVTADGMGVFLGVAAGI